MGSMRHDLTLLDLADAYDAAVFGEFYDEVLRPALPPSELEPKAVLEARLDGSAPSGTLAGVALGADGRVVGGVIGEWYPRSRCLLVGYLAVRPAARGQGIGSSLMRDVVGGQWGRREPLLVLGEVDDPRVASSGEPLARLRFFDRLSARLLRMPYLQPEVFPGAGRVRLLLVAFAVAPAALVGPDSVDGHLVGAFVDEYFAATEGPTAPDDHTFAALKRWTAAEEGIALLPLQRFEELPSSAWEALR